MQHPETGCFGGFNGLDVQVFARLVVYTALSHQMRCGWCSGHSTNSSRARTGGKWTLYVMCTTEIPPKSARSQTRLPRPHGGAAWRACGQPIGASVLLGPALINSSLRLRRPDSLIIACLVDSRWAGREAHLLALPCVSSLYTTSTFRPDDDLASREGDNKGKPRRAGIEQREGRRPP